MRFDLLRRWTEAGVLSLPMLESPLARQSRDGRAGTATCRSGGRVCGPPRSV